MQELEKIHEIKGKKFLFKVETSSDPNDYMKYEEIRNEIWGDPLDNMAGKRNLLCENFFHEGSSLYIGVYVDDGKGRFKEDKAHCVGFSYGFVGVKDKEIGFRDPRNIQFYSQYTGVRKGFYNYGLGILIKEFQRGQLINVFGIYTVICTFDPLTGVNAYRNIHHFGMDVVAYRGTFYGEFGGFLNRLDIPCDRFFITWDLEKKIERPEYDLRSLVDSGRMAVSADLVEVEGRSGPLELEVVREMNLELDHEFLLVEIPVDFYTMLRETDIKNDDVRSIPLDWRLKTRKAFLTLQERNYKVIDFRQIEKNKRKRDFYVLKKYFEG
jgi:predicted GNAT superfamily acetyltransferase